MATYNIFNGVTTYIPGGLTRVNADALNQVVASDNSVVALIGEADGGAPGTEGLVLISDPSRAADIFRSGPLADAARAVFSPSGDPRVPGGASSVYCYKTNASTQATLLLPAPAASLVFTSTATGGAASTLIDTTLGSTYADDAFVGQWLLVRAGTATVEARQITAYNASTQTFTVAVAWDDIPIAADAYALMSYDSDFFSGVDTGTSTTTVVTLTDATLVVDELIGQWVNVIDPAYTDGLVRQITDNTATTITVYPALPSTPATGSIVEFLSGAIELTSRDYGSHTNGITVDMASGTAANSKVATVSFEQVDEVSPDLGGAGFLRILYKGGATNIADTVNATGTTTSNIVLVTGTLTPSAHVGTQVLIDGEYTTITANTASALTVSPALSEIPAGGTAVSIRTVTGGTALISGANGAATSLTTTIEGVTGDALVIPFTADMTVTQLVSAINLNPSYLAEVAPGINGDTSLAADFDFGGNTLHSILTSHELLEPGDGFRQDCVQVVNYFNTVSAYVSATRATYGVNAGSTAPGNIADPLPMSGAVRGTSSNSSFQNGMDEVLTVRANSVVPLIDQDLVNEGYGSTATVASVAAQLKSHVIAARGASITERGGFIGFRGTKAQIIAQANVLNDYDVALTCQFPTIVNAYGSLQTFGPRMMAVLAAGMRAGVSEVGEPLTNKQLNVTGITQDSSWNPRDITDSTDLIKAGVLFASTVVGSGTRWIRDLTTWVRDNNLAYSEGSVRDVVRYIAYGLRETLVQRYVGLKAAPATIVNIKNTASSYLEIARSGNIIIDSTDPVTGAVVKAYNNLRVTSSGDTVLVKVGIIPAPGINWVNSDIYLQLPTQAA